MVDLNIENERQMYLYQCELNALEGNILSYIEPKIKEFLIKQDVSIKDVFIQKMFKTKALTLVLNQILFSLNEHSYELLNAIKNDEKYQEYLYLIEDKDEEDPLLLQSLLNIMIAAKEEIKS